MLQTILERRRVKRVTSVAIVAIATLGFVTLLCGVKAADKGTPPDKIKELQKQRVATLHEVRTAVKAMFLAGAARFDEVLTANLTALDADLDLAETQEQRMKLLGDAVTQAREFEETITKMFQSGQANRVDVLRATAGRLEREIAVERARYDIKK